MKQIALIFALSLWALSASAQTISASGQIGWIIPGGSGVNEENYDVGGGLNIAVDALYHLGDEGKLGVGIGYYTGILAGGSLDAFGMRVIGVKGLYELKSEGFTPYFGLTIGAASLETPETSINGMVVSESSSATGLGLVPQIGIKFGGGFYIAGDYVVPTNFDIEEIMATGSVGGLIISLGYRYKFNF